MAQALVFPTEYKASETLHTKENTERCPKRARRLGELDLSEWQGRETLCHAANRCPLQGWGYVYDFFSTVTSF